MTRERASIFASDDVLDMSAFAPKAAHELNGASAELVRGIAEASRFPSREAKASSPGNVAVPASPSYRPDDAVQPRNSSWKTQYAGKILTYKVFKPNSVNAEQLVASQQFQ